MVSSYIGTSHTICTPHMKPLLQRFEIWDIIDLEGIRPISNKYKKEWSVLIWDIPYYMHSSYETIYCSIFEIWDIIHLEDYKDTISNKYKKWMVSFIGRPILYALLIWNHFTAAFLRYGTLYILETVKTPFLISTEIEWSVLIEDIPYYAHLIWNHFTAAFLRYGT